MKKSFGITTSVIGIVVFAVTLAVFLLSDFEKAAVNWITISFVLVAEAALFMGIGIVGAMERLRNKAFISSGVITTLFMYFAASGILYLFSGAFANSVKALIIDETIITALAAVITIIIAVASKHINVLDQKAVDGSRFARTCKNRIYSLLAAERDLELKEKLNSIYENIKYSDKVGASSVDDRISTLTDRLEKGLATEARNQQEIYDAIDELSALINKRKSEIAESKRGGF